jgi:hypothetical protein
MRPYGMSFSDPITLGAMVDPSAFLSVLSLMDITPLEV